MRRGSGVARRRKRAWMAAQPKPQRKSPTWMWSGRSLAHCGRVVAFLTEGENPYQWIAVSAIFGERSEPLSWPQAIRAAELLAGRTMFDGSAAA